MGSGNAEDLIPVGSIITLPDGKKITITQESTIINLEEKEILVRNDDLWGSDRTEVEALKKQVDELKKDQALSDKQLELQKEILELERKKADLEKERAEFYKEQLKVVSEISRQTIDQLNEMVKKSQPSTLSRIINQGGWVAWPVVIGILIGLAL